MTIEKSSATWLRAGMALALVALYSSTSIVATEDAAGVDYELLVEGESVSIQAVDRPLIQVLRDLGDKMKFEVDADLGQDVRVTVAFQNRPVDEAVSILCKQVGYLLARNPEDQRIKRLVLTSKKGRANRTATRQADPPGWRPSEPPPVDPTEVKSPQEAGDAKFAESNRSMLEDRPKKRDD